MGYAKPIWNEVTSCKYKSNKSWGAFDDAKTITFTGSSPSNSNELAVVETARVFYDNFVVFNFFLDGKLMKQNINHINGSRAGDFIEQRKRNFLNGNNQHNHPVNRKLKNKQ